MKSNQRLLTAAAIAAFILGPAFGSTLIVGTFNRPGDLTIDPNQNLEFLAPSTTLGLTFNQVLSSSFVTQNGFRVATVAEVLQLTADAGVTDLSGAFSTGNEAGVKTLISFLGQTIPGPITLPVPGFMASIAEGFYGFAISPNTPAGFVNVAGADDQSAALGQAPQDRARVIPQLIQFMPNQQPPPIVGSFLVKAIPQAIPEPASLGVTGLGLAMLLAWRRKNRAC